MAENKPGERKLNEQELNERVAVLRRLKELLSEQRAKFREYLTVLEKQETSIASEDMEKLYAHTELEQNILGNISNLQKVIKPMEALYKDAYAGNDAEIPILRTDLSKLQTQILAQNEKNRTALRTHIDSVRLKLQSLQNPYKKTKSIYAHGAHTAVGAERFRIVVTEFREDGTRAFILDRDKGGLDGRTAEEVRDRLWLLERYARNRKNINVVPLSRDKHHILVDDLTSEKLKQLKEDGYRPACVVESSPGSFQAILTVPKLGDDPEMEREAANRLTKLLNERGNRS